MATIFDLVTPRYIKDYWINAGYDNVDYLGFALFPSVKQLGLTLAFLKGNSGLPVSLKASAFDSDVPLRERLGLTKIEGEMPFFREGLMIGEKDRQELLKVLDTGNQVLIDAVVNRIYDDATTLLRSAYVTKERMIMQLLASGAITMNFEGSPISYDYSFDTSHKLGLTGNAVWTDFVNSNPLEDIRRMQDKVEEDTGERPTRAICTQKTFNDILQNEKIRTALSSMQLYPSTNNLSEFMLNELGLSIAIYNKRHATGKFYPDNRMTLIPEGDLGNFYYGTTPEEADLMGKVDSQVELVDEGIAISTQYKRESPINVKTIVSMIGLPSAETMDKWAIISY